MFLPVLSPVSQEVVLNQAYNESDLPEECRSGGGGVRWRDDHETYDDERDDHDEYEHMLSLLYRQGLRTVRIA